MLLETGRVERVQARFAWVSCAAQTDCLRCREGKGCGGGLLGRLLGDRLHRVRAADGGLELKPGDRVELGLDESALVRGALQVYGLPLAGFFLAPAILAFATGTSNDFALLLAAAAGLLFGLLLANRRAHQVARDPRYQPTVIRRLTSTCSPEGRVVDDSA